MADGVLLFSLPFHRWEGFFGVGGGCLGRISATATAVDIIGFRMLPKEVVEVVFVNKLVLTGEMRTV